MDYQSIWPCLVIISVVIMMASRGTFAFLDRSAAAGASRHAALDGLRGLLAFAVVFHHIEILYRSRTADVWAPSPVWFYHNAGQVGVALFFMVTGFLFWGKVIDEGGRPDWLRLLVGRAFRIGPVYLLAAGYCVLVALAVADFALLVSPAELASQFVRWFSLGALKPVDINGYPDSWGLLLGVVWTLRYEWLFYLALPLMAALARRDDRFLVLPAVGLLCAVVAETVRLGSPSPNQGSPVDIFFGLFFAGMLSAALLRLRSVPSIPEPIASGVVAAIVITVLFYVRNTYSALPLLLLLAAFHLVARGSSVFGLLTLPGLCRIGHVSYPIYLLQGPLLLAFLPLPDVVTDLLYGSPAWFWGLNLLSCVALFLVAVAVHVAVEKPGIAAGRRAVAALDRLRDALPGSLRRPVAEARARS